MADAGDFLDMLESFDVDKIVNDVLNESTETMANLNAAQLAQGLRADSTEIQPPYADRTVFEKQHNKSGLAAVTDHVTTYDTGSHYRKLYAEVQGDELEYGSRDEKSAKLQKKYGKLYGLTTDSKEELAEQVTRPAFQKRVEEATGLKFT